ncbi:MAG: hypothetical protein H7Y08_04425 [Rhizobiaceae bacterium]|nr:hypothetical protein [Rhizobiaceae bacterium]
MQGILYEETSVLSFLFLTVVLGGGTAWMTGRACARTWKPVAVLILYVLLLGAAVRFIHYAVFGGTLLSAQYYIADTIILMIIGLVAFRFTRTDQMVSQYYWLYTRSGPLSWREIG